MFGKATSNRFRRCVAISASARALITSLLIKGRCFIKGRVCLNHDETIQIDFKTSSRLLSIDSFIAHFDANSSLCTDDIKVRLPDKCLINVKPNTSFKSPQKQCNRTTETSINYHQRAVIRNLKSLGKRAN